LQTTKEKTQAILRQFDGSRLINDPAGRRFVDAAERPDSKPVRQRSSYHCFAGKFTEFLNFFSESRCLPIRADAAFQHGVRPFANGGKDEARFNRPWG
jgi:hypothetical protein